MQSLVRDEHIREAEVGPIQRLDVRCKSRGCILLKIRHADEGGVIGCRRSGHRDFIIEHAVLPLLEL
jgi:hypothetical protein